MEIDADARSLLHTFERHESGFVGSQLGPTKQAKSHGRLSFLDGAFGIPCVQSVEQQFPGHTYQMQEHSSLHECNGCGRLDSCCYGLGQGVREELQAYT